MPFYHWDFGFGFRDICLTQAWAWTWHAFWFSFAWHENHTMHFILHESRILLLYSSSDLSMFGNIDSLLSPHSPPPPPSFTCLHTLRTFCPTLPQYDAYNTSLRFSLLTWFLSLPGILVSGGTVTFISMHAHSFSQAKRKRHAGRQLNIYVGIFFQAHLPARTYPQHTHIAHTLQTACTMPLSVVLPFPTFCFHTCLQSFVRQNW